MISEHQIQCQLVKWWEWQAHPDERPLLFAIPNGGARNAITGATLKREGVRAGVPDLFLAIAKGGYHGLFIELKACGGRASKEQRLMLALLSASGYLATIAQGFDCAKDLITDYMRGNIRLADTDGLRKGHRKGKRKSWTEGA